MTEEECIHLLDPSTCTICNGRDKREAEAESSRYKMFPAKYAGRCSACRFSISIGDLIGWREGEPVLHWDCVEEGSR